MENWLIWHVHNVSKMPWYCVVWMIIWNLSYLLFLTLGLTSKKLYKTFHLIIHIQMIWHFVALPTWQKVFVSVERPIYICSSVIIILPREGKHWGLIFSSCVSLLLTNAERTYRRWRCVFIWFCFSAHHSPNKSIVELSHYHVSHSERLWLPLLEYFSLCLHLPLLDWNRLVQT